MSLEQSEREIERVVAGAYRAQVPVKPLDESRLLDLLGGARPPRRLPRWLDWWVRPHRSLSPLAGVAAALALLGAGAWIGARSFTGAGAPVSGTAPSVTADLQVVEFVLVAPRASRVAVLGDFNGWDPAATPMRRVMAGDAWTAAVAIPEGRYTYAFVIDGRTWMPDPAAPLAPDDGFGLRSSVLVVQGSRSS